MERNWTYCMKYNFLVLLLCYKSTVCVHIMKASVGLEVELHSFLTLVLEQDKQSASSQGHFTTVEITSCTHETGG
jgi:hypothetical protein